MDKKTITHIFKYALENEADQLFVEDGAGHILVEYLLADGDSRRLKLSNQKNYDLGIKLREVFRLPSGELTKNRYCRFSTQKYHWDFFLTITPTNNGERVKIKIAAKNQAILRLGQLGLEKKSLKKIKAAIKVQSGLILTTSPDNQGRSTTLAALAKEVDRPDISVYWIGGQPSGYFANINFLANNENNWHKILTLDSEVVIFEIDSSKDLPMVMRAASTGRLIIASMKADSTWQALETIISLPGSIKNKLGALSIIINQRLAPLTRIKTVNKSLLKNSRQEIGLFEFLQLTPNIKNFIDKSRRLKNRGDFWESLTDIAKQNGYTSLQSDKQDKRKNGLI